MEKRVSGIPYVDSDMTSDMEGQYFSLRPQQKSPLLSGEREMARSEVLVSNGGGQGVFSDATDNNPRLQVPRVSITNAVRVTDHPLQQAILRTSSRTGIEADPVDITTDKELQQQERQRNVSLSGDDVPDEGRSEVPDIRGGLYQAKKTVAQGLLDIALLTANASQLKNLLETENHPNYKLCVSLLTISIILQLIVAILLMVVGRMDYEPNKAQRRKDNKRVVIWNDISTGGVFFITVVNIFIASFIAHGKAYIPPVNAEASWNEKMYKQQKLLWEPVVTGNRSL